MTDSARPCIVVHPPESGRGRRVYAGTTSLGIAYSAADLLEFLRQAGLDPDDVRLEDPSIEWRGGGLDVWRADAE